MARHSVADRAATCDGIRRHDTDEWRLLEEGHLEVELIRPVLGRDVAMSRPDDVPDVQAVRLFPGVPVADLGPAELLAGSRPAVPRLQVDDLELHGPLGPVRVELERGPAGIRFPRKADALQVPLDIEDDGT